LWATVTGRAKIGRVCHDCGVVERDGAAFVGARKPHLLVDRCVECIEHPLTASLRRVAIRRVEIAALRAGRRFRAAKPFYTAPLFAELRP
jgi:hypothetical protein